MDFRDKLRRITAEKGWEDRLFRKIAGPEKDPLNGKPKVASPLDDLMKREKVWMPQRGSSVEELVAQSLIAAEGEAFWWLSAPQSQTLHLSNLENPTSWGRVMGYSMLNAWAESTPGMVIEDQRKALEEKRRQEELERQRKEALKSRCCAVAYAPMRMPKPSKEDFKSPDVVGFLTGYRGWKTEGGVLKSIGVGDYWMPRAAIPATCVEGECYPCPDKDCSCGYYSFKDFHYFLEYFTGYGGSDHHQYCFGPVYVWGTVVETEWGWRSQYAYPKEIWCLKPAHANLGTVYNVPVRVLEEGLAKRDEVQ